MMETLCLTDEQARQIASGERVEVWVEMRPQPREGRRETAVPPFLPGDVVGVREAWCNIETRSVETVICVTYAADGPLSPQVLVHPCRVTSEQFREALRMPWFLKREWQPAETMPDWAIRSKTTCVSCVPEKRDQWGWLVVLEPTKTGAH
jgi:hypothetical protein